MINVNSNAQIVAMYSAQTIAKSSENSNTSDVVQTSDADSASFSPESLKQMKMVNP